MIAITYYTYYAIDYCFIVDSVFRRKFGDSPSITSIIKIDSRSYLLCYTWILIKVLLIMLVALFANAINVAQNSLEV